MPTQSLIYLLICGAGIIIFIFLIIIPGQRTSADLDREIEKLNDRVKEQRILRPTFDILLKRARTEKPTELPATKKVKLARGDINKVTELLQEIAQRHDIHVQDIKTDVDALISNIEYMLIRINITGDFMNFRDFLMDLGTIPSLELIEEVKIRAIEGTREYKLRVWIAQK